MKQAFVILVVLAVYAVWRFVVRGDGLLLVTSAPMAVTFTLDTIVSNRQVVIRAHSRDERRVTVISLSRELAAQLEVSPPAGFREETMPLTAEERHDSSAVAFAAAYDRETMRWAGDLQIRPNEPLFIIIPATAARHVEGVISLQYEARRRIGGSIASGTVSLARK